MSVHQQLTDSSVALLFGDSFVPPTGSRYCTPALATAAPVDQKELGVALPVLALTRLAALSVVALAPYERPRRVLSGFVRGIRVTLLRRAEVGGIEGRLIESLAQHRGEAEMYGLAYDLVKDSYWPEHHVCDLAGEELVQAGRATWVQQRRGAAELVRFKRRNVLGAVPGGYADLTGRAIALAQFWQQAPHRAQLATEVRAALKARHMPTS